MFTSLYLCVDAYKKLDDNIRRIKSVPPTELKEHEHFTRVKNTHGGLLNSKCGIFATDF